MLSPNHPLPTSPTSAVATQQQLRVSPLADIAADPATFLAARTARAMLGRDVTPCVVHVLNALLHAVVRAVVLAATQGTSPTVPLAANHVIEALKALAPIDAVLAAAVTAASATSPAGAGAAPLLPAQITGTAISELIIDQAQAVGCYDQPASPAPQAVVALNAALDVVAGLLLDSLAVTLDASGTKRMSIESVIRAITSDPHLAHVVRNVEWLEVLELLADEHDDEDEDADAQAPQFMFPTLLAGTGGAGGPDSPMYRSAAGSTVAGIPAPIKVDPSVPSPVIRSPGMSARHPPLPSPGLPAHGTLGRLPKDVKPGPLDEFDELLISSETKKITLTPKRLRVVEAGGSTSATTTRVPPMGFSNISTTSLPTVSSSSSSNTATTPTLPTSSTFTSLPMPTRSPPFSPGNSSRPIVSNPSATWDLAEFLNTTEPPVVPSASSPASASTKSSKSSRSSGFFGKKFASSKSQVTPYASPPPPVPTGVPERLPPGHPKYVMLPGADDILRQFAGQPESMGGRPASIAQGRRRSQAKPSEPDPASSTVSTSIAAAMPPVPSPAAAVGGNSPQLSTKSASSAASKRRSHSPAAMSSVSASATVPEGSAVAARMRATLAAAMADAADAANTKPVSRSSSSASRASMVGSAASPALGRRYVSLPRSRSMSKANGDNDDSARGTSPAPTTAAAAVEPAAPQSHSAEDARGRNAGGADDGRAPRRSSSVTRDRPGPALGPRGVSPARVPVGAANQAQLPRGVSPVRQQVVPADLPQSPAALRAMVAPAAEPSLPAATTSAVPPAPSSPLPALPPLPDSLADLTRADLERLVRLLHADATASRHVADHARTGEAAHKSQLDKLAVRAFKTITDLRKRDVERDAEMDAVRREREQVGNRLGQVLAVLGGVVPGLVPEEVGAAGAEGVVRSES